MVKYNMKHEYKVFSGTNYHDKKSDFWHECEEKRIANIIGIKKRLYTQIEWDYKTMNLHLKINDSWDNCTCQNELKKLREDYIKTVELPKKQQEYSIQQNVGSFYTKNEDTDKILKKILKIFDNVIESNCLDIVPIENIEFPQEMLSTMGLKS